MEYTQQSHSAALEEKHRAPTLPCHHLQNQEKPQKHAWSMEGCSGLTQAEMLLKAVTVQSQIVVLTNNLHSGAKAWQATIAAL